MPQLLIADDHPLFREALRGVASRLLPDAAIHEAEDAAGLYAMVEAHPDADLLLLDLNMPGAQGFSALVHLRAVHPQLPIVMVSAREEPEVVRRALDHGAVGFIPKSSDAATLARALQQVLDGERWLPETALAAPAITVYGLARNARLCGGQKETHHGAGFFEGDPRMRGRGPSQPRWGALLSESVVAVAGEYSLLPVVGGEYVSGSCESWFLPGFASCDGPAHCHAAPCAVDVFVGGRPARPHAPVAGRLPAGPFPGRPADLCAERGR